MLLLSTSLKSVLVSPCPTLAWCWHIQPETGNEKGFTSFDRNLEIGGLTYYASAGINPTNIQGDTNLEPGNLELSGIFTPEGITLGDVIAGVYDYAKIDVFLTSYTSPGTPESSDVLRLPPSLIGKVTYSKDRFSFELIGRKFLLQGRRPHTVSRTCRYDFGDSRCTADPESFAIDRIVSNVDTNDPNIQVNESSDDDRYTGTFLTWISGANSGLKQLVIRSNGSQIYLREWPPEDIQQGDGVHLVPQCRKTHPDCDWRFGNWENFGGEPTIPGLDTYYSGRSQ